MTNETTDIAVTESRLIQPAGTIEEALAGFHNYQELQSKLGTPDDFQSIGQRSFPKKSFVRKVQRYFGLSAEIIRDEPVVVKDKLIGWTATVRAMHAPTGAFQDGDGSCGIEEKATGQGTIHNLRAHAVTRAKNRAVMDLVGFGDVTADEMVRDEQGDSFAQSRGAPPSVPPAQANGGQYGTCPEHGVDWFMRGQMRSPAHPIDTGGWCNKPDSPPDGPRLPVEPRNEGEQGDGPIEDDAPPLSAAEEAAMGEHVTRLLWPRGRAEAFMAWALEALGKTASGGLFVEPRDVLAILKPNDWVGGRWTGTELQATMSEDEARGRITHYIENKESNDAS